jgi:CheY-like chemotaxis protein
MGPSVLVVCEDDLLGASICAHLARARINVQGARTLAEFKSSLDSWMFDIAVCDIDLPDGSGGEFIPQLRMTAGCGIIALSANPTRESRLLAMRLGADYHLAAPVDCEELELTIRSLHRWTAVRPRRSQGRAGGTDVDVRRDGGESCRSLAGRYHALEADLSGRARCTTLVSGVPDSSASGAVSRSGCAAGRSAGVAQSQRYAPIWTQPRHDDVAPASKDSAAVQRHLAGAFRPRCRLCLQRACRTVGLSAVPR